MSIRNPSDFFEQKKKKILDEELAQKRLEEQKLNNKKIDAPKKHFGEERVVKKPAAIIQKEVKTDPYLEEINLLRSDIQSVVGLIPDETDLTEVFDRLENLKERIDNIADKASYEGDLDILRSDIKEVERSIPEQFDPSNINSNLSALKERIEFVRSEIPIIPEPVLYDDQIDEIKKLIEQVKESIPEVPEVKYYEKELNLILDLIEGVREDIPTVPEIPEIKYYDEEISSVESQIKKIESSLSNLPEIKHYDNDIDEVKELLEKLSNKIPKIPEIKYYDHDIQDLKDKILNVEESIPTIPETKSYDEEIKELNKEIVSLFKKVSSIKIPEAKSYDEEIKNIRSLFEKKNSSLQEKIVKLEKTFEKFDKEILSESIDPKEDNSDPLTPLDQKFVTYEKLQENYRLFVNRVQQQLSSFGGGGIEDAPNDGQTYSRKDSKWVVGGGGGVGAAGTWAVDPVGINTIKNVGIGSTARSDKALFVQGDAEITGNISVGGTLTYEDVKNVDSIGIITARSDVRIGRNLSVVGLTTLGSNNGIGTVHIGSGHTALMVDGDARIVGVLTVGRSSITLDGEAEQVSVGIVTITNTTVNIGQNVQINSVASGINSAPNVLYVAKDGDDSKNGTSIDNAKLTIAAAVGIAQSGTTIKVLSGNYVEQNPIEIPAFVAVVGDDLRTVKVLPNTPNKDLFHVRKGCKLSNMTFSGHTAPAAAVGFPTTEIAENVGGGKWKGPYIQNCTSDTTTGTGIRIDGKQARLLKTMNVDAYTQYNQGGVGVAVTNGGFAQLVSLFTICCDEAVTCDKGGQADIANSNCSFGSFGLVSRGTGALQFTGVVTTTQAALGQDEVQVNLSTPNLNISNFVYDNISGVATVTTTTNHNFVVGMAVTMSGIGLTCAYGSKTYPHKPPYVFEVDETPSDTSFVVNVGVSTLTHTYVSGGNVKIDIDKPYDGQYVYFDKLYKSITTINITNGGNGYTSTPDVNIDNPTGPNGEYATAFATLEGDSVSSITVISSGTQYETTPSVTIAAPNIGNDRATAVAVMEPIYYTINSSTSISTGDFNNFDSTLEDFSSNTETFDETSAGATILTLEENLLNNVSIGSTAYFYQFSRIVASSHTFEYVGAGNTIALATPKRGGVTIQENEVVTLDGGKVVYTSTDQSGNFRIGDGLQINQNSGTISGRAFTKSLFTEMTPFILALS